MSSDWSCEMARTRWLAVGVLAIVAVAAFVLRHRGPARIAVDTVKATRQNRFVSASLHD
jgi:hypothetical protein